MKRMLYDMKVKGTSGRAQSEMRNRLLDTVGKVILVMKQQRTWPNCVPLFYGN